MNWYNVSKDFSAPVVTHVAAIAATWITYRINRNQLRIAQSQRDIAFDRLKFDLHNKRYEIYEAAKPLEHVIHVSDWDESEPGKIKSLYIKLDESRFYFPPEIQDFLRKVHDSCQCFLVHLGVRGNVDIDHAGAWRSANELLAADNAKLHELYTKLPSTFEQTLAFEQLTTANGGRKT